MSMFEEKSNSLILDKPTLLCSPLSHPMSMR